MSLKATCPTSPDHKRFVTTAHVMEEWIVDEHGNWIETLQCLETDQEANPRNTWTCKECGEHAKVERM